MNALLRALFNLSLWNTINILALNEIIKDFSSVLGLPDILLLRTHNIINMKRMFEGWISLDSMP